MSRRAALGRAANRPTGAVLAAGLLVVAACTGESAGPSTSGRATTPSVVGREEVGVSEASPTTPEPGSPEPGSTTAPSLVATTSSTMPTSGDPINGEPIDLGAAVRRVPAPWEALHEAPGRVRVDAIDLNRLSAALGTTRPADPLDVGAVAAWLGADDPAAQVVPPGVFTSGLVLGDAAAIRDELGFTLGDLDGVVNLIAGEGLYFEFLGPIDASPAADDLGGGVLSIGRGADGQLDFGEGARTEYRRLGRPRRLANLESGVAMSLFTEAIEFRLAVDRSEPPPWVPELAPLGEALVASDPVAVTILAGDLTVSLPTDALEAELARSLVAFRPTAIAVGLVDRAGVWEFQLHFLFASEQAALDAVEVIGELVESGESVIAPGTTSWSEALDVSSVVATGPVVTVSLTVIAGRGHQQVWQRIDAGDLPFAVPVGV